MSRLEIRTLDREGRAAHAAGIAALDGGARYPLGADAFSIDHGADYFAFFDRLGEVRYEVALDEGRVVAAAARVLRRLGGRPIWYLCGLKVAPSHRGRHLPFRIASHALPSALRASTRGYGISMNPGDGSENRVVRLLARMKVVPLSAACELVFFSLDAGAMRAAAPMVEAHRGPVSYLSLRGVKDIVLESTGAPMPLWHVQFGPNAAPGVSAPVDGGTHMFCAPRGDALTEAALAAGLTPSATATVVQRGLSDEDFRAVLTSEI